MNVFFLILIFSFYGTLTFPQVTPYYRAIDWTIAGARYDFPDTQTFLNVIDFGAVGNGIDDDFNAISSAINSLNGFSGTLYFPPGTYLLHSPLVLTDSVRIKGSSSEVTSLVSTVGENQHIISVSGNSVGSFIEVYEGYEKNSLQLTLSETNVFEDGDIAELIQEGEMHMTSDWAMNSLGQIIIIDSVSENTIFIKDPIRMDYLEELNPRIRKITPIKAVSIECIKIKRETETASQTANINFNFAYNSRVLGVESELCNFAHIRITKSTNITIKNSYFYSGHDYGGGGKAYGIAVQATTGACLIENNIFQDLRHSMLLQSGANANVFAYNYSIEPYWTGVSLPSNSAGDMVLHGNYPYLNLFEGNIAQNIVIDDSHGINGHHNTFLRNRAELYGIFMNFDPPTDSVNFIGNEITNEGFMLGLYYLNGINHFEYGNNVKGNIIPSGTDNLTDISYYYQSQPDFWFLQYDFPSIGPPNPINNYSIPAKERFVSGQNLAYCNEIPVTIPNKNISKKDNEIISIESYDYDNFKNGFEITVFSKKQNHIEITCHDILGRNVFNTVIVPTQNVNSVFIPISGKGKTSEIFILNVVQGQNTTSKKMITH